MSMIDVETSAEAIQEDEELIEAVGNLVETAAVSLKSEIVNTIEASLQSIVDWIELLFPVILDYQRDESLFWQDLQKLAIFTVLFAVSYVLLTPSSPSRSRRKRRRIKSFPSFRFLIPSKVSHSRSTSELSETVLVQSVNHSLRYNNNRQQHLSRHSILGVASDGGFHPSSAESTHRRLSSSTICSGRIILEEETDEERFRKSYPSIAMARYRRLVLPPACKLVEKPKVSRPAILHMKDKDGSGRKEKTNESSSSNRHKKRTEQGSNGVVKKSDSQNDEDNPEERLHSYMAHFLYLVKSLLSYDYTSAGWTLINWLQAVLRIRQYRRSNSQSHLLLDPEEEDDDDDDNSKASHASSVRSLRGSSNSHPMVARQNSSTGSLPSQQTAVPNNTPVAGRSSSIDLDASFCSARMEEEKKESPVSNASPQRVSLYPKYLMTSITRNERLNSVDSDFDNVVGEADVGEHAPVPAFRLPLSKQSQLQQPYQHKALLQGKKRDLLENYRSSSVNSLFMSQSSATAGAAPTPLTTIDKNLSDPGPPSMRDENDEIRVEGPLEIKRETSDYGSYFFETVNSHDLINKMELEAALPDKNGYILGDKFLPNSNCTPLLVFVNSRSGPQQGHLLISQLRRLLNPIQVWDLADGGPEEVIESFCSLRNLRIMVCGGDGTVSWIIATLEKMDLKRKWPPIAVLPLGTGNDLARIHGWGGGYNNESLIGILEQVADSYISLLDRWEMTVESRKGKVKDVKSFFNYLGVGADAQTALQVHMLRESKPNFFFSRVVNKAWYGLFGAEDIIKATSLNLPNEITLIADGVEVPLPPDSQGIILLNIDSYAGGVPMWANGAKRGLHGDASSDNSPTGRGNNTYDEAHRFQPYFRRTRSLEDLGLKNRGSLQRIDSTEDLSHVLTDDQKFERVTACNMPSSCQDGILDVVSIRGAFHLGQIRVGLSNAQRVCQCREATIHIKRKVAVQVDGEPWRQNVCTLRVKRKATAASMLHRSSDENAVETEMAQLLDWAEERKLIDGTVHSALMKEFSRRIEDKTRQRRFRSQDNLMFRAFGINQ